MSLKGITWNYAGHLMRDGRGIGGAQRRDPARTAALVVGDWQSQLLARSPIRSVAILLPDRISTPPSWSCAHRLTGRAQFSHGYRRLSGRGYQLDPADAEVQPGIALELGSQLGGTRHELKPAYHETGG